MFWDRSRAGEQATICGPELLTLSNVYKGQRCTLLGIHRRHQVALVETQECSCWVLVPLGCLVFVDAAEQLLTISRPAPTPTALSEVRV